MCGPLETPPGGHEWPARGTGVAAHDRLLIPHLPLTATRRRIQRGQLQLGEIVVGAGGDEAHAATATGNIDVATPVAQPLDHVEFAQ